MSGAFARNRHLPTVFIRIINILFDKVLSFSQGDYAGGQRGLDQQEHFQGDWAARVLNNGKVTGLFSDYHYYGTGDIGTARREESVKRLETIITKGSVEISPLDGMYLRDGQHQKFPAVAVGNAV
jgi:alpha-mannosidase